MKKFQSNFEVLAEQTLYRHQQGGFLCGDYVKYRKDALKNPCIESMSDQKKELIKSFMTSDTNLKISYIKSEASEAVNGPIGAPNVPGRLWADIIVEYAPGMWRDPMTVPITALEKVEIEDGVGYPQYSKDIVRDNDNSSEKGTAAEQTLGDDKERQNPTKNTKLAHTSKPKSGDGSKGLNESITMLNENDAIFEKFTNA